MNDEDLLGYFEIHSRTELALFHKNHIERLLMLAGESPEEWMGILRSPNGFLSAHSDVVDPLVKKARARMDIDNARYILIAGFVSEESRAAARNLSLTELALRAYGFRPEQDDLLSEELRRINERFSSDLDSRLAQMRAETEYNVARMRRTGE